MLRALTREPSPAIADCELTHLDRVGIDADRVAVQHRAYEVALAGAGCALVRVPEARGCPDGIFVEDCAVVVDGLAVLTRPGAVSRRAEVESVGGVLAGLLPLARLREPGTLDGGDVLRMGDELLVGLSARTNGEGLRQLARAVDAVGLRVRGIEIRRALHLKTAVTAISEDTVILNPDWVDREHFARWRVLETAADEPFAGNTLRVADTLIVPAAHPRAAEACARWVPGVVQVEVDEIARAEGGVTCCSILVRTEDG